MIRDRFEATDTARTCTLHALEPPSRVSHTRPCSLWMSLTVEEDIPSTSWLVYAPAMVGSENVWRWWPPPRAQSTLELLHVDASSADFSLRDLLAAQRIMMSVGYMPCGNVTQRVSIESRHPIIFYTHDERGAASSQHIDEASIELKRRLGEMPTGLSSQDVFRRRVDHHCCLRDYVFSVQYNGTIGPHDEDLRYVP